ncbi:N-acetylmuramoyl-L-alanine amidase [Saxibacter everestensis]|uniref:N-acetylmuramoyl-L-alanine amidase n=1 Tax=Saxibacter everestensis TaxID=2909229 RepID=A0ABY8QUQ5_9MICO|nr:N-acetylmuramoyl-L-alanine amidase [Brevibacteriaceae bacterium ZFBP1038]
MSAYRVVCIHTMVGSLAGTDGMFKRNGFTGTESHFGTGGDGTIYQWQDTAYSADANYLGSRTVISIENADHGPGFKPWNTSGDNVPPFTAAQIEANAQIIAWAHKTHGIPIVLIPNTRPEHRGVGYHAQGVPGNGLVSGGVTWSKARGKVCPGRRRIAQIPQIIARAKQIAGGASAGGGPAPTPAPAAPKGILGMSKRIDFKRSVDIAIPSNGEIKQLPIGDPDKKDDEAHSIVSGKATFGVGVRVELAGLGVGETAELALFEWMDKPNDTARFLDAVTLHGVAQGPSKGSVHGLWTLPDEYKGSPMRLRAGVSTRTAGVSVTWIETTGLRD